MTDYKQMVESKAFPRRPTEKFAVVEKTSPDCGSVDEDTWGYKSFCPRCDKELARWVTSKFCGNCGQRILLHKECDGKSISLGSLKEIMNNDA